MEFATREAREATFAPPSKRAKAGGWPHKTPTAADLARAGFYFKPSSHSNDNTVCFLCDRNLDGWEAEDDPVEEHAKHAEDCGWAVLMSVEAVDQHDPSNMEDPTGQQMTNARHATFTVGWPHENKRGWTCKTNKMVEAGWYFAPTSSSEDYVSCAYCKLSLDGWEPKDNPFEEHYSRSPSCPFFVFAGSTTPAKRAKAKKGRTSRASRTSKASTRLSTQSDVTIQSEAVEIPELDQSIDTSAVSLSSTMSAATVKAKRKAGAGRPKTGTSKRAKGTKSKKTEPLESGPEAEAEAEVVSQSQSQLQPPLEAELDLLEEEEKALHPTIPETVSDTDDIYDTQLQQHGKPAHQPSPIKPSPKLTPEPGPVPRTRRSQKEEEYTETEGPPRLPTPTVPVIDLSPIPVRHSGSQPRRSSGRLAAQLPEKTAATTTTTTMTTTPPRSSPSQPSDVENAPPSTRPVSVRPPLSSPGTMVPAWKAIDVDMVFERLTEPNATDHNGGGGGGAIDLPAAEKQMTVQAWIKYIAERAEGELRAEGERVVGIFEQEGQRALTVLEGIQTVCV